MFSIFRRKNRKVKKECASKSKGTKIEKSKNVSTSQSSLQNIPGLLEKMLNSNDEKSAVNAAKNIVDLCNTRHLENRIRMVCSEEHNVLPVLAKCLAFEENEARRMLACAALVNLSSSPESRVGIANGPFMKNIIDILCNILHSCHCRDEMRALCLYCLRNLSMAFSSNTVKLLLRHSPCSKEEDLGALENPKSLLRVLETLLKSSQLPSNHRVVTCDLIQNLSLSRDNAKLIAKTEIPKLLLDTIRSSTVLPSQWESGSLEKISLYTIHNLGRWPECRQNLINIGTLEVMKAIVESKKNKVVVLDCIPKSQVVKKFEFRYLHCNHSQLNGAK